MEPFDLFAFSHRRERLYEQCVGGHNAVTRGLASCTTRENCSEQPNSVTGDVAIAYEDS